MFSRTVSESKKGSRLENHRYFQADFFELRFAEIGDVFTIDKNPSAVRALESPSTVSA